MTTPDAPRLSADADELTDRVSVSAARRHVGAAGFAQRELLERIITAGREQLAVTQSLRRVLASTVTQLNALPLVALGEEAPRHRAALEDIVTAGQAQIERAGALRLAIQEALSEVRNTPLEQVSGQLLGTLGGAVQRQVADLEGIVGAAVSEAGTIDQLSKLERLSAELQQQLLHAEHDRAEQELLHLNLVGDEALARVRQLEEAGESHAVQKIQLEEHAEATRQQIAHLEDAAAQDRAELAHLKHANAAADTRLTALRAATTTDPD